MVTAAALTVRNLLAMAGASSLFVLFLSYRELRWTTNHHTGSAATTTAGAVRTANRTTDTAVLYNKEMEPVSSVVVKTTPTPPPLPVSSVVEVVPTTPTTKWPAADDDDKPWPKLNELISGDGKSIVADVQFVLDFAIIGHPKCATTASMFWLANHQDVQMPRHEVHAMIAGRPAELVRTLYDELAPGYHYKRGYKAPRDITNTNALTAFATYFPATKLIIGVRHPVLWFQSFYNYRVRGGTVMPPAETLMGELQPHWNGVSTDESMFHVHLDHLGKTARTMPEELALLGGGGGDRRHNHGLPRASNRVFLYESSQLHDTNATRAQQHLLDLQHFLELSHPLSPMGAKGVKRDAVQPGMIDICDAKYIPLRIELMKNAIQASRWIREYFLRCPDVTVSSPEYFGRLLEEWMQDPCDAAI